MVGHRHGSRVITRRFPPARVKASLWYLLLYVYVCLQAAIVLLPRLRSLYTAILSGQRCKEEVDLQRVSRSVI